MQWWAGVLLTQHRLSQRFERVCADNCKFTCLVCSWCLLQVVFTERVSMADDSDPAPTAPLLAALQHKDPIVQVGVGLCVNWINGLFVCICVRVEML